MGIRREIDLSGFVDQSDTNRSPFANGSGRSMTAFTTLNIAVALPMPSAIVSVTTMLKSGYRRDCRRSYRASCAIAGAMLVPGPAGSTPFCFRMHWQDAA